MSGEQILGIVTAICTAAVTITGILVRANVIALGKEIKDLKVAVASSHAIIMHQNEIIQSLAPKQTVMRPDTTPLPPGLKTRSDSHF